MKQWWIVCFSLLMLAFVSTEVTAQKMTFEALWQQEFEYDGYSTHTTSVGDLLNISFSYVEPEAMIFDYYLLDAKTGNTKKSIPSVQGFSYVFTTPAQELFLLSYAAEQQTLTLYNEQLQKLWSIADDFSALEHVVFYEYHTDGSLLLFTESNPLIPLFAFDLVGNQLAMPTIDYAVPSIEQCPGELYCPTLQTVDVEISDAMRSIQTTITLAPALPDGHLIDYALPVIYNSERYYDPASFTTIDWHKPDRYFMYIGTSDETEQTNRLIEFNLSGQIISEFMLPAYTQNFDYAMTSTVFGYFYDQQYVLYDLATYEIKQRVPLDSAVYYVTMDYSGKTLLTEQSFYRLTDDLTVDFVLKRPSPDHTNLKILQHYYVVSSYEEQYASHVYDAKTRLPLAAIPYADDYVDTNNGQDIIAYRANAENYTYTLQYMKSISIAQYEPTKMWTISFNAAIDPASVHHQTVYVMNERGEKVNVQLVVEDNMVHIVAAGGYVAHYEYTLYVKPGITAKNGKVLTKNLTKTFAIQ